MWFLNSLAFQAQTQIRLVLTKRVWSSSRENTGVHNNHSLADSILTSSLADMAYLGSWPACRLVKCPDQVYCNCLGPEKLVCDTCWWSVLPVTFTYLFSALYVVTTRALDACGKNLCFVSNHKTEQNYMDSNCSVTNMNKVHWMLRSLHRPAKQQ